MIELVLFGTEGCHLCEQAEALIDEYRSASAVELSVEIKDITEDEQAYRDYALRIPVLFHQETQQTLAWPFDRSTLREFIKTIG
ncbi:MAG: glutaredoxin family protein [Gammaproteobacteria bacterium]